MSNKVVGTAVEVVCCHNVVASLSDVLQSVGDGSGSRGHSQSGHTSFEGCHAVFEDGLSGIGQTTVDVTCITQAKAVGSVLRIAEDIGRGLINGHRTCIGCGVGLFLAYVELQGLETIILLCAHNVLFLLVICFVLRCKGTEFRNNDQISCIIQKYHLSLHQQREVSSKSKPKRAPKQNYILRLWPRH